MKGNRSDSSFLRLIIPAFLQLQDIEVTCSAEVARVMLEDGSELYMRPTCIQTQSSRLYEVRNTSRIALEYEWKLHHAEGDVLSMKPANGVIQPNEIKVRLCIIF